MGSVVSVARRMEAVFSQRLILLLIPQRCCPNHGWREVPGCAWLCCLAFVLLVDINGNIIQGHVGTTLMGHGHRVGDEFGKTQ